VEIALSWQRSQLADRSTLPASARVGAAPMAGDEAISSAAITFMRTFLRFC
jgi:hypothetical protein